MPRNETPWYDSDNPSTVVRGATWRGLVWVAAILAGLAVISGIGLGIRTLTAEPVGRANAYQQQQSATNRIFAQETFEKLHADIEATRAKIAAARGVRASSDEAETRYQGLISYCAGVVADYNAAARSYRTEQFRAADLPSKLDPITDCEPSA
jgi:alcohol dehydrogenase class IV